MSDSGAPPAREPGEITPAARARIRELLRDLVEGLLADDEAIDRWFGTYVTSPKRGHAALPPAEPYDVAELREELEQGAVLRRSAVAHFAHVRHDDGSATLFAGGTEFVLAPDIAALAPLITGPEPITADALDDAGAAITLFVELINDGWLWVDEDGDEI